MNKLRNKVFLTIFIILNIFSISLLIVYNYQNYKMEYDRTENSLNDNFKSNKRNNEPMRFFDINAYTVILNDGEILSIISHTKDGNINNEILKYANTLLDKENKTQISNLYTEKYSYKKTTNYITIIDNTKSNERLKSIFKFSIILLILIEIISYLISLILSNWIIKPVEEAFDKQKQFVADASHELKTPLAVIMASADALEKNKNELKWLKNIQSESERMNKLVTNLLDLSKIENTASIKEEVNLSKLVEKSILTLESLMFEKNIDLNYKIDDNIKINSNSEDLKKLISILLDNAIKHSSENGKVIVNLIENKNLIELEVKNKGKAIKKEEEEKIFERFYRSDESRNRDENRYGLGLAIAKGIVLNNNGNITAHSENGYTTFKVILKKK